MAPNNYGSIRELQTAWKNEIIIILNRHIILNTIGIEAGVSKVRDSVMAPLRIELLHKSEQQLTMQRC